MSPRGTEVFAGDPETRFRSMVIAMVNRAVASTPAIVVPAFLPTIDAAISPRSPGRLTPHFGANNRGATYESIHS